MAATARSKTMLRIFCMFCFDKNENAIVQNGRDSGTRGKGEGWRESGRGGREGRRGDVQEGGDEEAGEEKEGERARGAEGRQCGSQGVRE